MYHDKKSSWFCCFKCVWFGRNIEYVEFSYSQLTKRIDDCHTCHYYNKTKQNKTWAKWQYRTIHSVDIDQSIWPWNCFIYIFSAPGRYQTSEIVTFSSIDNQKVKKWLATDVTTGKLKTYSQRKIDHRILTNFQFCIYSRYFQINSLHWDFVISLSMYQRKIQGYIENLGI